MANYFWKTADLWRFKNGKTLPEDCEHIPTPLFIYVSIRVFRYFPDRSSVDDFKTEEGIIFGLESALQIQGGKCRFSSKSSKFDLLSNKNTSKYINISHIAEDTTKKEISKTSKNENVVIR